MQFPYLPHQHLNIVLKYFWKQCPTIWYIGSLINNQTINAYSLSIRAPCRRGKLPFVTDFCSKWSMKGIKMENISPYCPPPNLVTVPEAARILGVGRKVVYQLLENGFLNAIRRQRKILIDPCCLYKFLDTGNMAWIVFQRRLFMLAGSCCLDLWVRFVMSNTVEVVRGSIWYPCYLLNIGWTARLRRCHSAYGLHSLNTFRLTEHTVSSGWLADQQQPWNCRLVWPWIVSLNLSNDCASIKGLPRWPGVVPSYYISWSVPENCLRSAKNPLEYGWLVRLGGALVDLHSGAQSFEEDGLPGRSAKGHRYILRGRNRPACEAICCKDDGAKK